MPPAFAASPLRAARLFQALREEELDEIAAICRLETVPAGTWLFHTGDAGKCLWVIKEGAVEILIESQPPQSLAHLSRHDVFGELSVLEPNRRSAGARVTEDSQLLRIDYEDFAALREASSPAAHKFVRELTKVVCERIRDVNERISQVAAQPRPDEDKRPEQRRAMMKELLTKLWSSGESHG